MPLSVQQLTKHNQRCQASWNRERMGRRNLAPTVEDSFYYDASNPDPKLIRQFRQFHKFEDRKSSSSSARRHHRHRREAELRPKPIPFNSSHFGGFPVGSPGKLNAVVVFLV